MRTQGLKAIISLRGESKSIECNCSTFSKPRKKIPVLRPNTLIFTNFIAW